MDLERARITTNENHGGHKRTENKNPKGFLIDLERERIDQSFELNKGESGEDVLLDEIFYILHLFLILKFRFQTRQPLVVPSLSCFLPPIFILFN